MKLQLLIAFSSILYAQKEIDVSPKKSYTIGYMKNILGDVDINDAQAAVKLWIKEVVNNISYVKAYDIKSKIYLNMDEFKEDLKNGDVALLRINMPDYFNYGIKLGLEPAFIPTINGNVGVEYYLLTRKNGVYKSLKDLKGINIGISSDQNLTASRLWLDIMLTKNNLPAKENFFNKIIEIQKESQLLLDLFFGQLDACIVSDNTFKLMAELNPQISADIICILKSPRYLQGLLCFTKNLNDENDKKSCRSGIMNVNQLTSGKQILSLIKIDGLVLFQDEYIVNYKNLLKDYNNLQKKRKKQVN